MEPPENQSKHFITAVFHPISENKKLHSCFTYSFTALSCRKNVASDGLMDRVTSFKNRNFLFRIVIRLFVASLSASVATAAVISLVYLLYISADYFEVSNARFRVPAAVVLAPFIGFVYGFSATSKIHDFVSILWVNSKFFRGIFCVVVFYEVALLSYIHLFEPQGLGFRRGLMNLSESQLVQLLKLTMFPLLLLVLGLYLFKVVTRKPLFLSAMEKSAEQPSQIFNSQWANLKTEENVKLAPQSNNLDVDVTNDTLKEHVIKRFFTPFVLLIVVAVVIISAQYHEKELDTSTLQKLGLMFALALVFAALKNRWLKAIAFACSSWTIYIYQLQYSKTQFDLAHSEIQNFIYAKEIGMTIYNFYWDPVVSLAISCLLICGLLLNGTQLYQSFQISASRRGSAVKLKDDLGSWPPPL